MASDCRRTETRIISVTTILILSAFLIGLTVGNFIGTDLEPYVLACGLSGMLAFIGLELAAFQRKMNALEVNKRIVEDRLDRHILSQSSAGFNLSDPHVSANVNADTSKLAETGLEFGESESPDAREAMLA
ncbi:MAG: hypothetical protein KDA75_05790 [Planctomycetaceae bacterium]|nr:hypothetical protein [Planctomycetaceae bacterium]